MVSQERKLKRFINSFKYALCGIKKSLKNEQNIYVDICMMLLVIVCGFIFKISYYEWLICIALFGQVMSLELFNTAIEKLVDLVSPERQQLAGDVKDIAAGAVLVSAIVAAVVGLIIFVPKFIVLVGGLL